MLLHSDWLFIRVKAQAQDNCYPTFGVIDTSDRWFPAKW
jgi:hypothetical protein